MTAGRTARMRQAPRAASYSALRGGFLRSSPDVEVDAKGYVADATLNLIAGVQLSDFEADVRKGNGNEMGGKFRAVHSSTALAVNSFGPFKRHLDALTLLDETGFSSLHFERKCPHGVGQGNPPNLDVLAASPDQVIAVESKCTEYFTRHVAEFRPAYDADIRDERRDSPWFRMMCRLTENPNAFRRLNAAQLVKHAFGLAHTFSGHRVILLYVFWEPTNPEAFQVFSEHRTEIDRFAEQVSGGNPSFASISYPELWERWKQLGSPEWLHAHVARLRKRYLISM